MGKSCVEVIRQFRAAQIADAKSELTAKTYAHAVTRFHEWLLENGGDIADLTRHDIQSYINHLDANGISASTINKTFAALSVFSRYIGRTSIVESVRVPEFRKSVHVAPKSLERNDKNRVLREVERKGNLRDIAIAYTLLHTKSEVGKCLYATGRGMWPERCRCQPKHAIT